MSEKLSFDVVLHGGNDAVLMVSRSGRRDDVVTIPRSKATFMPFSFTDRQRKPPVHVVMSTQGTLSLHIDDARLYGLAV